MAIKIARTATDPTAIPAIAPELMLDDDDDPPEGESVVVLVGPALPSPTKLVDCKTVVELPFTTRTEVSTPDVVEEDEEEGDGAELAEDELDVVGPLLGDVGLPEFPP